MAEPLITRPKNPFLEMTHEEIKTLRRVRDTILTEKMGAATILQTIAGQSANRGHLTLSFNDRPPSAAQIKDHLDFEGLSITISTGNVSPAKKNPEDFVKIATIDEHGFHIVPPT